MPELPLGLALLSLGPGEEKGQGASSPPPPGLGTPVPHIPRQAWLRKDARTGGCPGCRVPGDGCCRGCSGAPRGDAGPGTKRHGGDARVRPGLAGNAGRLGGRAGSWMCSVTVQLLKSADLGRQSLLYLKEIGHGWFGKVSGRGRVPRGYPDGTLAEGPGLCETVFGVRRGCTVRTEGTSLSLAPGVPGGGELGHQQHPGGGEGAEGERQRAGPDAVPGGSAALQVQLGSLRRAAAAPGTAGTGDAGGWRLVPSVPFSAAEQSWSCPMEVPSRALRAARLCPGPAVHLPGAHCGRMRAVLGAAGRGAGAAQRAVVRSWAEWGRGGGRELLPAPAELNKCPFVACPGVLGRAGTRSRRSRQSPRWLPAQQQRRQGDGSPGAATVPPAPAGCDANMPPLLCPAQGSPAHQPPAVPGPVRRSHPVPAGDGVLPAGESRAAPSVPSRSLWSCCGAGKQGLVVRYHGGDGRAAGRVRGSALPCWARLSPRRAKCRGG